MCVGVGVCDEGYPIRVRANTYACAVCQHERVCVRANEREREGVRKQERAREREGGSGK